MTATNVLPIGVIAVPEAAIARLEEKMDASQKMMEKVYVRVGETNGRVKDLELAKAKRDAQFQTWTLAFKVVVPAVILATVAVMILLLVLVSDPLTAAHVVEALL